MAVIRVTRGGLGITLKDAEGRKRHVFKDTKSDPFECDDRAAERFVRLGVATYVGDAGEYAAKEQQAPEEQEPKESAGYTREDLEGMKNADLKELAESLGIDVTDCVKKAEYVEAILSGREEEQPELDAEDPVG